MSLIGLAEADDRDALDDYIEAQVHGRVALDRDMEALVLDPCYRGTAVEAAARRLPCPVEWHPGYRLSVEELRRHPDFRGPRYVELGARIAEDGHLDPRVIGDAARTGRHDPQDLKKVWHCLARFGAPAGRPAPTGESRGPVRPLVGGSDGRRPGAGGEHAQGVGAGDQFRPVGRVPAAGQAAQVVVDPVHGEAGLAGGVRGGRAAREQGQDAGLGRSRRRLGGSRGVGVRGSCSPSTRSRTSSVVVASTVSLTGSAVSSPYRSVPPGVRQRTETW